MSASVSIPTSLGLIKEFITLFPTPWKKIAMCLWGLQDFILSHFPIFFLSVICLKTPSKCAAEGWDFIDNRLISLHKWERGRPSFSVDFFARWIISFIWFSDPESILKLEKDVAVPSKNRRQILLILLRGETMVMGVRNDVWVGNIACSFPRLSYWLSLLCLRDAHKLPRRLHEGRAA